MITKYAFVLPRFGRDIIGGAETLMGELARRLAARGDDVDILTTCAVDNRTWENQLEPGELQEDGLTVHRFPVSPRNLDTWVPLQIKISEGGFLTVEEQLLWMQESVNSSELYEFIASNSDNYKALFFGPYLFGTTFWGSLINPKKSVLIPCLHDESYAYLDIIQSMFRQVGKCLFNAKPEQDLAESLYGNLEGAEVGMGFELNESEPLKPYFEDDSPYVLYLGRKETGKNLQVLIDYFKDINQAKLVIAGGGDLSDVAGPEVLESGQIIDLGRVSEEDKQRLLQNALALCQPSTNESFSIVLMEAWAQKCPVMVPADCAVTSYHVEESSGGLIYDSKDSFKAKLDQLLKNNDSYGQAGFNYVKQRYSWRAVLGRFDSFVGLY